MTDFSKELNVARKAAEAASIVIRKRFGEASNARVKGDAHGLVTDTDLEAEKAIFDVLKSETSFTILSEESGLLNEKSGLKWVVDPLDGTNNFARSLPLFTTSIGLMEDNEFVVGVISEPLSLKTYYATKGGGAFCNDKKIELPVFNNDFNPMVFLNHGYDEFDRNKFKMLANRLASIFDTLKLGTTALELCHVATGSVDAFICSGDALWDFAAGAVITTESGCKFTDWQGNPWDGKGTQLLFARPEIHQKIVDLIKDI
jgi:myo-inositol-1(or 4)-monophosphatase